MVINVFHMFPIKERKKKKKKPQCNVPIPPVFVINK